MTVSVSTDGPDRRVSRRFALGALALIGSTSVAGFPAIARALAGAGALLTLDRRFTAQGRALVDALNDTVIPATDTPGAVAAGGTDFIQHLLTDWMSDDQAAWFVDGLNRFDADVRKSDGKSFVDLSPARRLAILTELESKAPAGAKPVPFVTAIKSLAIYGYYTSEVGSTEELDLNLVPGMMTPCAHVDGHTHAPSIPVFMTLYGFEA